MFKFASRIWITILAIGMVLSLSFNIAIVGFASVSAAVAGLYDAVTGTTSVVTSLRQQVSSKETRFAGLVEERDHLTAEVAEARAKLSMSESRIGKLEADIAIKESRIANMANDISLRDGQIASLSDEVADLRRTRSVIYRGERRLLREAVTDTNGRIARRTAVAASRNASSVVAEAIPYLGIAAMLGVTAYDLKDSCDTIKDLHALDVAIDPSKELGAEETEVCGLRVPSKEEVWQSVKENSSEAWDAASIYLPDLPEFELPSWRDLAFWN